VSAGFTGRPRWPLVIAAMMALVGGGFAAAETVLITGANSGIGLEFAKQYAEKGWTVIATHRRDTTPAELAELKSAHANVRVEKMDVASLEQVRALAAKLRGQPIDVLINNAGIFSFGDWMAPQDPNQQFGTLNYEQFDDFMHINVRGPLMVSETFIDNVRASKQKKIVMITSTLGTISTPAVATRIFWYGTSKAALNKATVTLAEVLKDTDVIVVPMHPGSVRVEKQAELHNPGMLETPDSVRYMIGTIDHLTKRDSGKFLLYDGSALPW
jgi:NAD(P)-dependent dehydrogenase (short-subunit alcohol dehydrogenase family)